MAQQPSLGLGVKFLRRGEIGFTSVLTLHINRLKTVLFERYSTDRGNGVGTLD